VEFDGLTDGLYSFTARAAGDVTPAVAHFVIDTQRPVADITCVPKAVTGGGDVAAEFRLGRCQ